jgi:membrane associated rhomboid family serine protease
MIPIRDAVPTRTRPVATWLLVAGMTAAFAWPPVRRGWLPWCATMAAFWLFGRTVEDRFGRVRFAVLVIGGATAAAAAAWWLGGPTGPGPVSAGAAAGVLAAHFLLFPRSKILTLVPVVIGVEVTDVPAWVVAALWALVQAADVWARAAWSGPARAMPAAGAIAAGAAAGAVARVLLARPERMRVDWWDSEPR